MKELIEKLLLEKGCIVSSASLDEEGIAQARASNRFYVDDNNYGFAWMPECWIRGFFNLPEEKYEDFINQLEKYFPIDTPLPESLKDANQLFDIIQKEIEQDKLREKN